MFFSLCQALYLYFPDMLRTRKLPRVKFKYRKTNKYNFACQKQYSLFHCLLLWYNSNSSDSQNNDGLFQLISFTTPGTLLSGSLLFKVVLIYA